MANVLLESDGHIRTITLNVPDKLNALSWPLLDDLASAVRTVARDENARVLVITGSGRAFSSGADITSLFGDRARPLEVLRADLLRVYGSFLGIRDLTIPTIAAVHGAAVGAGLNIALACDVIVAGPNAGFGATFTNIGLHPGGGCTFMLTRRIGTANTAAALFAGDIIKADDAFRLGIAQEIVEDPLARAHELATLYASREPGLMADVKQAVRTASDADFDATLAVEVEAQARSLKSAAFEAFAATFG